MMAEKISYKRKLHVSKRQQYRRIAESVNSILRTISDQPEPNSESALDNDDNFSYEHNVENLLQTESYDSYSNSSNEFSNVSENEEDISCIPVSKQCEDNFINVSHCPTDLKTQLCYWATVKHKVSHSALNDLLKILSPYHPELPICGRTLLKTPTTLNSIQLENGEYVYLGILKFLKETLALYPSYCGDNISLRFNVDGLPLFHSSNMQLWPILGLITNFKCKPIVIALFCGSSKPSSLDIFLGEFVTEICGLAREGFEFNSKRYTVSIHSFNCDAPARAFIKCTKSHGGYSSCDKCTQTGEYIHGRVVMRSISAPKRTDLQFQLLHDEDHHLGVTPLSKLPVGLVSHFPIDYMHAVCLGVMRKLLNTWVAGNLKVRLPGRVVKILSELLLSLHPCIPMEFNRKPRSLTELSRWKATEYRLFLLYLGPLVLKSTLPVALYENFLLFHFGITLMCSKLHIKKLGCNLGGEILNMFVKHCETVYGSEYLIYNIHMMCHLSDDVKLYGCLDNFSTFPFENHLGQLKKLVRSPNKPLQQIFRRLYEINTHQRRSMDGPGYSVLEELFNCPSLSEYPQYKMFKKMKFTDFTLKIHLYSSADCYCLMEGDTVLQVHNILVHNSHSDNILLHGKQFQSYKSLYTYPLDSKALKIFIVGQLSSSFIVLSPKNIISKCMLFPFENQSWVSIPLVHALEC